MYLLLYVLSCSSSSAMPGSDRLLAYLLVNMRSELFLNASISQTRQAVSLPCSFCYPQTDTHLFSPACSPLLGDLSRSRLSTATCLNLAALVSNRAAVSRGAWTEELELAHLELLDITIEDQARENKSHHCVPSSLGVFKSAPPIGCGTSYRLIHPIGSKPGLPLQDRRTLV